MVDGQGHVATAVRALELSQPGIIRRAPGDAIVSAPGADPGDTWDRHRVDASFGEQLLGGESQKEFRIWLPVEDVGWMVLDDETWRSWDWLCWDEDLDGERGEKTGVPTVVVSERWLR
jgi:hypothetical protein